MSEKNGSLCPGGKFLYGNVELRTVQLDEAEGTLMLRLLCADREWLQVTYRGVYASRLKPVHTGQRIALAEEVPLSLLREKRYSEEIRRLFSDREPVEPGFLRRLECLQYKLYLHYMPHLPDCMVVAREAYVSQDR